MTIYVIRNSEDNLWKIGHTNGDTRARLNQLQTGNPHKLDLYAEFPGDVSLEKAMHEHLIQYHTAGGTEWFFASQDDIDDVIQTYRSKWTSEPIAKTSVACKDCYHLLSSTNSRGREVHECGILWDQKWSALEGEMIATNPQSIEKARSRIGECGPGGKLYKNAEEEWARQKQLQREQEQLQYKEKLDRIRTFLRAVLVIGTAFLMWYSFATLSSTLYRVIAPKATDTPTPTATLTRSPVPTPIPDTPTPIMTQTPEPTATPAPTEMEAPRTTVTATPFAVNVIAAANLRAGPGTEHAILGAARPGQLLAIAAANPAGDWLQLADGSWVAAALVERVPATVTSQTKASVATDALVPARTATYTPEPTVGPTPTLQPQPRPVTMKDVGADVTLLADSGATGVCPTKLDFDELTKLAMANDMVGLQQLINSGRVLVVSSGTKAKIIETGFTAYRIRIMSGTHAGRDGWVVREAVQ